MADNGFEFTLESEVEAHGEKVKLLKFREPSVNDILAFGNPVDLAYRPIDSIMVPFIAHLSSVPTSTIKTIKTRDYLAIVQAVVARFFFPKQAEGQT